MTLEVIKKCTNFRQFYLKEIQATYEDLKEYFQKKIKLLQNENLSFEKQLKRSEKLDEVSKGIY